MWYTSIEVNSKEKGKRIVYHDGLTDGGGSASQLLWRRRRAASQRPVLREAAAGGTAMPVALPMSVCLRAGHSSRTESKKQSKRRLSRDRREDVRLNCSSQHLTRLRLIFPSSCVAVGLINVLISCSKRRMRARTISQLTDLCH